MIDRTTKTILVPSWCICLVLQATLSSSGTDEVTADKVSSIHSADTVSVPSPAGSTKSGRLSRKASGWCSACNVMALPITGTRVIKVSNESQLQSALNTIRSGDTILLAAGTYNLTKSIYINGKDNVTIRGAAGCDDVVLAGKGMDNVNHGNVTTGIWSNSINTTIAHLTIRDTYDNEIIFNAGAQSPHVYSVKLLNAGSQFIKSNPVDKAGGIGVNNGVVEYSWFEYTNGTPSHPGAVGYTNGISAHAVNNWVVRGNLFKNLHTPDSADFLWNPAVLMWNHSRNTITENNVFINVDRAIAYGLQDISGSDHYGGVIRNNFIYLAPDLMSQSRRADSDAAIIVWNSPSTSVNHNTILANDNVANSIEFRFNTSGSEARNNLADGTINLRGRASCTQSGNYLEATKQMFVDASSGNLHLVNNSAARSKVIDQAEILISVPKDIDGERRPHGVSADIGADEFVPAK